MSESRVRALLILGSLMVVAPTPEEGAGGRPIALLVSNLPRIFCVTISVVVAKLYVGMIASLPVYTMYSSSRAVSEILYPPIYPSCTPDIDFSVVFSF